MIEEMETYIEKVARLFNAKTIQELVAWGA